MKERRRLASGFALIEAMVIVAVAAMLATLFVLAALHRARSAATDSRCLNNLRRLSLGWQMYAADNGGILPYNADEGDQPTSGNFSRNPQWCPGEMESGSVIPGEQTNTAWVKAGQIYPYVGSPSYYRCPADTSTAFGSTAYALGGRGNPRVRSVSMNAWIAPVTELLVDFGAAASNYRVFRAETDLANPGAANLWLLTDENPWSINDACFISVPAPTLTNTTAWDDIPATYHNGSGGISFCDGHAQMRRWTDRNLIASKGDGIPAQPPYTDLHWLLRRTTAHR